MATNPNMVAIQTVTVGSGGAASIEFTNIPQTYTDLILKTSIRNVNDTLDCYLRFNGATTNFSDRWLYGTGSAVGSTTNSNIDFVQNRSTYTASTFGSAEIYIPNYSGTTNKSVSVDAVTENNATASYQLLSAGLWSNTAAITSIQIVAQTGNIAQYSTATLYGVTSAGYGAKATGGIITSDANYYYHTFLASGTFTPTQSITADCLVIAGGGGGGGASQGSIGGGGGAGGYQVFSSQSLTAQNYTVTIGGGGSGGTGGGTSTGYAGTNGSNSQFGSLTASVGGGYGGGGSGNAGSGGGTSGNTGGSGGGAGFSSANTTVGGAGTSGQGYKGADEQGGGLGGGGGGSGAASTNSDGGVGTASSIGGTSVTYAIGGSGAGTGGNGVAPAGAAANRGLGGDAGWYANGAAGGSGIIIVRYAK